METSRAPGVVTKTGVITWVSVEAVAAVTIIEALATIEAFTILSALVHRAGGRWKIIILTVGGLELGAVHVEASVWEVPHFDH